MQKTKDNKGHGTLFIISAPSGAGKTSLVKALVNNDTNLNVSISYTTRNRRSLEEDGIHYFFTDEATFLEKKQAGCFLECAKVFNHYYGTSKLWVENQIKTGVDIILEIDWQGAYQVIKKMKDVVSIFILPPSHQALENRLNSRAQDGAEIVKKRLNKAVLEISKYKKFDYIVINDHFEKAVNHLESIIKAKRLLRTNQEFRHQKLLHRLLSE